MRAVLGWIAIVQLLWAGSARADELATLALSQAKAFYQALDYERCLKRLKRAGTLKLSEPERAEVALYQGLCGAGLGQSKAARKSFQRALELDPQLQLPLGTSPRIVELFEEVGGKRRTRPAEAPAVAAAPAPAAPAADVPSASPAEPPAVTPGLKPAAPPVVTERPAFLPQAQPPKSGVVRAMPYVLGGASLAVLATGVVFGVQARSFESQARGAHFDSDMASFNRQAASRARTANILFVGSGVVAAATVVSALLQ
ncbi:hypothetical protein CYFUS_009086 [Cystobacter fuscus]|uniref:Uncharacterized protein n=1 Tax=Cystobacter fuscus TaxID=43 RepID=A0A250JKE8_9BACT|nr:tetratricopeptide repeat protein [Cystobacter fuscus]ATB43606.1 hypothetical protein CYFUS_009086 [Cystobacter fuscus]